MRMIKEHDVLVLTEDLPEEGLNAGDVGTVVHINNNGEGYEVEFMTLTGQDDRGSFIIGAASSSCE